MNGDGDDKISSLNASKGWLKNNNFCMKNEVQVFKCLTIVCMLMCCDKIKPSSWVKTWERRMGWRLLGTRYNRDTRLQTPGTAPLVTQMCHNLAPARAQRGQGPGGSCDVRNLSVAWISVRGSNMILGTNIVSDLEQKIELETNLREVWNLQLRRRPS